MTAIINLTELECDMFALFDHHVRQFCLLVTCATFEVASEREVVLQHPQRPLLREDIYHGNPGESSVKFEADIALWKPQADILLDAYAYAPGGKPAERVPVGLRVGALQKDLLVRGDRPKGHRLSGFVRPFVKMPIIYERALGGPSFAANPVGVGYKRARPVGPDVHSTTPNIESLRGSAPAGYGPVSRAWPPRRELAGTYDNHWMKSRAPLLPSDFEPAFYQAAPVDQRLPAIHGGEYVELVNMTPDGYWGFELPRMDVPVRTYYEDRSEEHSLCWDTLVLEPELRRFTLTGRTALPVARGQAPLREVIFGHASSAFLRSRTTGQSYLDLGRTGGRMRGRREFR